MASEPTVAVARQYDIDSPEFAGDPYYWYSSETLVAPYCVDKPVVVVVVAAPYVFDRTVQAAAAAAPCFADKPELTVEVEAEAAVAVVVGAHSVDRPLSVDFDESNPVERAAASGSV
jgi:hypothetical protein